MNKKAIICTVAILILLVGASVIYFTMNRSSEAEPAYSSSMSVVEPESSNSQSEMPSESQAESESQESASETTSSEVNSPEADALIKTFAEIGEPYTLHSRYYNQGEAKQMMHRGSVGTAIWSFAYPMLKLKNTQKAISNMIINHSGSFMRPNSMTRVYCIWNCPLKTLMQKTKTV